VDAPLDPSIVFERAARGAGRWRGGRFLKPLFVALAAGLLLAVTLAFLGIEVRSSDGTMVITLGRSSVDRFSDPLFIEPELREMVRRELEGNMEGFFEALSVRIDSAARQQEMKQSLFAYNLYQQREEDMRFTRDLVRRLFLESAAESERNRRTLEGIAWIVCQADPETHEIRH
jgi:hypothetical protein